MSETMVSTDNSPNISLRDIYQTVFMIQKILIVNQESSLPVYEKDVEQTVPFESSMIAGILQAISSIGQEMIGRPTGFKKLQFNGFVVTGSYFDGFSIYVFSETELIKEIDEGMQKLIRWFGKTFGSRKENWDGSMDIYNINKTIIESKISQHLFLWLLYPLKVSTNQQLNKVSLSVIGKAIFGCITKNVRCSCARLLDYFKQYDEEEILYEIFNLVVEGYITTSFDD